MKLVDEESLLTEKMKERSTEGRDEVKTGSKDRKKKR